MLSILENTPLVTAPSTNKTNTPASAPAAPVAITVTTSPNQAQTATTTPPVQNNGSNQSTTGSTSTTDPTSTVPNQTAGDRYSKLAKGVALFGGGLATGGLLHAIFNGDVDSSSAGSIAGHAAAHDDVQQHETPVEKETPAPKPTPVPEPHPTTINRTVNIYQSNPYAQYPRYQLMTTQPDFAGQHLQPGNPAMMYGRGTPFDHVYDRRVFGVPLGSSGRLYGWRRF